MTVKVELAGSNKAQIDKQIWTSEDPRFAKSLNRTLKNKIPDGTYDPDPDLTAAKDAIKYFGGKIVSATKPKYVKGRIY